MIDNKIIYSTIEFQNWSQRSNLLAEEKILIKKYLNKNLITLEAGTASGRILFGIKEMGYRSLYGFDFVENFIAEAKRRNTDNSISFTVQDASNLNYSNDFFDQAIYLQQIISSIEDPIKRVNSIHEAYRILKKGGTILFSFLSFDSKGRSLLSKVFFLYLNFLRTLFNKKISIQYLPWFKHAGKPNWNSLRDKDPYNYWFKSSEIQKLLEEIGFSVVAIGYTNNILENRMHTSYKTLKASDGDGHIYFICKKP